MRFRLFYRTIREWYTVGRDKVESAAVTGLPRAFAVLSQTACSVFLGMGESNCAWNRKALLHRDTMLAAAAVYGGKGADHSAACVTEDLRPVVYPLKLPVLFPFLSRHHQISCPSFKTQILYPHIPFQTGLTLRTISFSGVEDFSCEAFSESLNVLISISLWRT